MGSPPSGEKPFWFRPPYMVLFDIVRLHKVRPWDIDIRGILSSFIDEMRRRGFVDFAACGMALFSSATLHRIRSELLLKDGSPRPPPVNAGEKEVSPPLLQVFLKPEFSSTSLEELAKALATILKLGDRKRVKNGEKASAASEVKTVDVFLVNIEKHLDSLYAQLVELAALRPFIPFWELVKDKTLLEVARTFLMLLFLASAGKVELHQAPDGEFLIGMTGDRLTT